MSEKHKAPSWLDRANYDATPRQVKKKRQPEQRSKQYSRTEMACRLTALVLTAIGGLVCVLVLMVVMVGLPAVSSYLEALVGEPPMSPASGCSVVTTSDRASDWGVDVVISGRHKDVAKVDIRLPGSETNLSVQRQYHKKFIDSGEAYIHQTYAWDTDWREGKYRVYVRVPGRSAIQRMAHLKSVGQWWIRVTCN